MYMSDVKKKTESSPVNQNKSKTTAAKYRKNITEQNGNKLTPNS